MKQFMTVLKFELNSYLKNKSFLITTCVLALAIAALVIVPTLIPGLLSEEGETSDTEISEEAIVEEDASEEMGLDSLGIYVEESAENINIEMIQAAYPADWTVYSSKEELKEAVQDEEVTAGFVMQSADMVTYVVNDLSMTDYLAEEFTYVLADYYKQQYLLEQGLTPEEIMTAESFYIGVEDEVLGTDSVSNYAYTYILVFVVYFLIIFYGQMIATAVTTEKSNRAIEILVTSVSPNSLICGKVLAGAIAGVGQATLILGSGFVSYNLVGEKWGGILDFLFDIPSNILIIYAIFALLSYVLYAFIFGMLGALVSKTEDISKSSMPVLMIYIVSFFIAIVGMTDSNSMLMKVASYIPFTSGNAMFVRVSMGSVEIWEVLLSGGILAVSCVIAGVLAAKIFRFGTLHYGNPIKFRTALKKSE